MPRPKKEQTVTEVKPADVGYANPTGLAINRDNVKVEVTEKDKEEFFKCFLGDLKFEDEKSLFDGRMKVVFKSITVEENNDIWRQVDLDGKNGTATTQDTLLLLINVYRLAMSLFSIDGVPFTSTGIMKEGFTVSKEEPDTTYVKARADKFKNWETFKLSSFLRAFNEFENKLFQLESTVTTQNFWKAAE